MLCLALVLASVGGLFWAKAALASSGASSVPLGDYAGWVDASGIAAFGSKTDTHPTLASDYLDRTDGWAAMDNGGGEGGWDGSGLPARARRAHPARRGHAGPGCDRRLQPVLHHAGEEPRRPRGRATPSCGWVGSSTATWYPWSVANNTDAANFAAFWRQIVDHHAGRARRRSSSTCGTPNQGGPTSWDLTEAYPGNAYVDYVGSDIYDEYWGTPQTPQNSWSNILSQSWGLNWLTSFAASEGKPIAIPEWSVCFRSDGHGLGDDPYFINEFANWIATNNVAFTDIFSYNDTAGGQDNDITNGDFPNALAAFKADFGGGSGDQPALATDDGGTDHHDHRRSAPTTTTAASRPRPRRRPPTTHHRGRRPSRVHRPRRPPSRRPPPCRPASPARPPASRRR